MIRSYVRRGIALLAAAAASVGGFAATGAFASDASTASSSVSEVSAPSASQVAAFPVLGQPATAADNEATTEIATALAEAQAETGANPSLARQVVDALAGSAFVVPANNSVCLVLLRGAGNGSALCKPTAAAASEGLGATEDVNNESFSVIGVFPASAQASNLRTLDRAGKETGAVLSAQSGYAIQATTKPVALRWTGPQETQQSQTLFWPALP